MGRMSRLIIGGGFDAGDRSGAIVEAAAGACLSEAQKPNPVACSCDVEVAGRFHVEHAVRRGYDSIEISQPATSPACVKTPKLRFGKAKNGSSRPSPLGKTRHIEN